MRSNFKDRLGMPAKMAMDLSKITFRVLGAFAKNGLASLIPLMIVLLLLAVILFFVNLSAPLAPFVYSLF